MALKKNIIANYLGQGWTALMGIAFVPLYIKYLGMEAYGLIGVFAILQAWLTLLDMGMAPTLNREMARYTAGAHNDQTIRDLLRSLEVVCIATAGVICVGVWISSGWLSANWLRADKLPLNVVTKAITIMGFVVGLRLVEGLYKAAMMGLQHQVWLSAVGSGLATLRWAGAVGVLLWVTPSIEAFFMWQGAISIVTIVVYQLAVYRHFPRVSYQAQFSIIQLRSVWHFASGMMATTLLALLLTQVDKILLSHLLPLDEFGVYTLATMVASVIALLVAPITQAIYPRFTELVTQNDMQVLVVLYHRGAQLVTVLLIPATLSLMLFGENILTLWTGNAALAHSTAPILRLLVLGTFLNSLLHLPYMMQLAYGWSRFAVKVNIVAVIVFVPAIFWVAPIYGSYGVAWLWVLLNCGYVLLGMHFMHHYLLPREKWRWYFKDVAFPALGALSVGLLSWALHPALLSFYPEIFWILVSAISTMAAATMAASELRPQLMRWIVSGH